MNQLIRPGSVYSYSVYAKTWAGASEVWVTFGTISSPTFPGIGYFKKWPIVTFIF
jgi:hypothetical protein